MKYKSIWAREGLHLYITSVLVPNCVTCVACLAPVQILNFTYLLGSEPC